MRIREKCKGSAPILRKRKTTCLEPQFVTPPTLTQLGNNRLQLVQISLVLSLVLDLLLDTLQDPDSGRVIVDLSGRPQGSLDDRGRGDEIVSETVVQASLELKDVLDVGKEGLVTLVEGFVGFGLVGVGTARVEPDGCGRRRKSS